MGKHVNPPPSPDFAGLATSQGAANAEAARVAGRMNNPNIYTPYGSQTVEWGAGSPATPPTRKWIEGTSGTPPTAGTAAIPGTAPTPENWSGQTASDILVGSPETGGRIFSGAYWTDPALDQALQAGGRIRLPGSQDWLQPQQMNGGWTVGGHGLEHLGQTFVAGTPGTPGTAATAEIPGTPGTEGHWEDFLGTPAATGDQPTITQRLTPAAEQAIREQQNAELNLSRIANWMVSPEAAQHPGTLGQVLRTPFSFGGTPTQTLAPGADLVAGGVNMETPDSRFFQQMGGADYGAVTGGPNLEAYGRAAGIAPGTGGPINQNPIRAGGAIGGVDMPNLQTRVNPGNLPIQAGPAPGQYGFAGGAPGLAPLQTGFDETGVARSPINAGTTAQQVIMSRLQPELARQRMIVETQLINQGLRPGDEAYDNAIRLLGQQENDQLQQAALHGLNLDLAANAQGFGQAAARAGFGNQAALETFGAGVTGAELGNRAVAQNFQQALTAAASGNAAQQQDFIQRVQAGEFGNAAQMAAFGAGLTNQRQYNAANAQNFIQNLQAQEAQRQGQAQAFEQGGAITASENAAIAQRQQAALQQQVAANAAQEQGFGQAQTRQQAGNAATQQNFQNRMQQQQAWNQAQQQRYAQILQSAQFGNAAQQQALAQLLQQRQVPLNEVSAMLSGSQVVNPQFPAYQGQAVAPAPVFAGGQAQAGWDQNIYNQRVAQANTLRQGLFSLAGAGISALNPFSLGGQRRVPSWAQNQWQGPIQNF